MKDVLVFLSPTSEDHLPASVHYGLSLASAHQAFVSVLIAEPRQLKSDDMHADNAATRPSTPTERLVKTAELVLSAAKSANVPCEILGTRGVYLSLRERLIRSVQVRDILIVDVDGPLEPPRKDLVDGALFSSGRPLVLVPQGARQSSAIKIAVAWDATPSAVRAVHDALALLKRAREVSVVSVVDDKTPWTPDTGDALCRYLKRWDVATTFTAITRASLETGTALLNYARQINADLLVMGGFAHGFERELMLGSATRDIYRTSIEIPVFLSH